MRLKAQAKQQSSSRSNSKVKSEGQTPSSIFKEINTFKFNSHIFKMYFYTTMYFYTFDMFFYSFEEHPLLTFIKNRSRGVCQMNIWSQFWQIDLRLLNKSVRKKSTHALKKVHTPQNGHSQQFTRTKIYANFCVVCSFCGLCVWLDCIRKSKFL